MKHYVADTHALVWFLSTPDKLGPQATRIFELLGSGSVVHVSVITLWEVALLHEQGHLRLPSGFSAWRARLSVLEGIRVEPLLVEDIEEARGIGAVADPFDRLLAGTALRLSAPLISKDRLLKRLRGLRTVW